MKTSSQLSAFALLVLVVMMMAMMVQASDLFGEINVDPDIAPVEYNGKLYYIHKDNFTDFELSRSSCAADGGMLVEINDSPEYDFIEGYLVFLKKRGKDFRYVIGGKYQPDDSQWVLPSTGAPLPFITSSLQSYSPDRTEWKCLELVEDWIRGVGMHMATGPCHENPAIIWPIWRYICERMYAPYSPTQLPNADPNIPAIEFRDKIYYIHKKLFTDYQANLEDCKADGGMMAEINDGLEFQVVQKYVNSTFTSVDHVFIGGKKTGNSWVLPSTNQPLPYVKWGHHEPYVYLDFFTCLILFGDKGWNMASMYCDTHPYSFPNFRFLCEKPIYSY